MSVRTIWTADKVKALRNDVNALVAKGSTKTDAYKKLSSKWKIGWHHLANLYGTSYTNPARVEARRARQRENYAKKRGMPVARSSRTIGNAGIGTTMTPTEAIQFYNFCRQLGITIS